VDDHPGVVTRRNRTAAVLVAALLAAVLTAAGLRVHQLGNARAHAGERAAAAGATLHERLDATALALAGIATTFRTDPARALDGFATQAAVSVGARPELSSAGWAPLLAGENGSVYPLRHSVTEARLPSADDLGADPRLGPALREARTTGRTVLSASVRLTDGRVGAGLFVPVYDRGLPAGTPGERHDALLGFVVGTIDTAELAHSLAGIRVTDAGAVLAHGPGGPARSVEIAGRTWRLEAPAVPGSWVWPLLAALWPALPLLAAAAGRRRRVRALRELDALEDMVSQLADDSGTLVLRLDADGRVGYCSPAGARMLGYVPRELVGRSLCELLHPDDMGMPAGDMARYVARDGGDVTLATRRSLHRDESGRLTSVTIVARRMARSSDRLAELLERAADPLEVLESVVEEARLAFGGTVTLVRLEPAGHSTVVASAGDAAPARGSLLDRSPEGTTVEVRLGARTWGTLTVDAPARPDLQVRLAQYLAGVRAAIGWADATLRLSSLGMRDEVTNLPDARAFHDRLLAEVQRASRHGRPLALALLDLDGFGELCETHGRLAGDRVLAEAGRRIAGQTRRGEFVARVGADRFAWILPEAEGLDAWIAADRARTAVSGTPFAEAGLVAASAGVSDLLDAADADELFAFTELALAGALANGGGLTFRYSSELQPPDEAPAAAGVRLAALRTLAHEIDSGHPGTEGHSERVARVAEKLALLSGWSLDRAIRLGQVALVHDVGKAGVSDAILLKPAQLDEDELREVRDHPEAGAKIAAGALDAEQRAWLLHHHERWDGTGYPAALAQDAIPDGARILAVAEAWDTMTSPRAYGVALDPEDALEECRRERGRQFAPDIVDALERLWTLGAIPARKL
jgi:diguanylate cyclase (GGDEF)-like protein/PAS domain S-box-containing protein